MRSSLIGLILVILGAQPSFAQTSAIEQEIIDLSRAKWQWMAEKNVDTLATLFHDQARFVHMSGSWGKEREIEIIRSGSIHYKHADIHQVANMQAPGRDVVTLHIYSPPIVKMNTYCFATSEGAEYTG